MSSAKMHRIFPDAVDLSFLLSDSVFSLYFYFSLRVLYTCLILFVRLSDCAISEPKYFVCKTINCLGMSQMVQKRLPKLIFTTGKKNQVVSLLNIFNQLLFGQLRTCIL